MPPSHPKLTGFTLVELMVTTAVASIIMFALFTLVGQSTSAYRESRASTETFSDARSLVDFLEREIRTKLPGTRLLAETTTGGPDRICFVHALTYDETVTSTTGDLRTSVYYVATTADSSNASSPKLFRHVLDGTKTQAWMEQPSPVMPVVDPSQDEPLLHNVTRFEAKPRMRGLNGTLEPWDPTLTTPPDVIELAIDFVDDAGASRFRRDSDWRSLANSNRPQDRRLIRKFERLIPLAR